MFEVLVRLKPEQCIDGRYWKITLQGEVKYMPAWMVLFHADTMEEAFKSVVPSEIESIRIEPYGPPKDSR